MADKRTLTVSLVAEVASLKKGMNEARNSLGMLQKSSQATASVLRTAFAGAATVMAFQAVSNGIRNVLTTFQETATAIEDTKHLADALGATTQEIQVLQRAAQLAEVDMDMLNRNVKMLTKNLGNASMGTGPAKEMLDRLGMSAQELIQMPLPEQLAAIGQRMQGLGSAAQRVAVATALFGKSGTDMIPFLLQSADSLREVQDEMQATGQLFSDEQAAMVDEMGDSVTMAWGIWEAFKNQLVIQVAPAIQYLADLTRDWASSTDGAVKNLVANGLAYLVDGIASVIDSVNKMRAVWYGLKAGVLLIATSLTFVWQSFASTFNLVMTGVQEVFFRVLAAIGKGIDKLTGAVASLGNAVPGVSGMAGTNFGDAMQGYVDEAVKARQQAWDNLGGGNSPFMQSLAKDSADALSEAQRLWSEKSTVGDQFRKKATELLGMQPDSAAAMAKEIYDDNLDILEPLQEEKKLREDINGIMGDTVDMQKELSKDFGEGAGFRAGEYTPPVGSITGGVPGGGAVGMTGAAMSGGRGSTGAGGTDGTTSLLQGILDATRLTAINTGRASVPVYG
jgi:hypothetical protein